MPSLSVKKGRFTLKLLFSLGGFALHLPLYLLTRLTPRNRKLWIFGSWFGQEFADNPRYLAQFIRDREPDIDVVWLSRNREAILLARRSGITAHHAFSPLGYFKSARAGVAFVSTSRLDVNPLVGPSLTFNLWHGTPIKQIMASDSVTSIPVLKRVAQRVFPQFTKLDVDIVVMHERETDIMTSAFGVNRDQVHVTGYPRNDLLTTRAPDFTHPRIAYMPTHRAEGTRSISPLSSLFDGSMDSVLESANGMLLVKAHHYHQGASAKELSRIRYTSMTEINSDTYTFLESCDILITDYSSVFVDFLLTDRPIIFAPFDLEEYLAGDRKFFYDYGSVTPGPKCRTWLEVGHWIMRFREDPGLFSDERARAREFFHKFEDGHSSSRIISLVRSTLDATRRPLLSKKHE